MKQVNIFTLLLAFVVSIHCYIYIDYLSNLTGITMIISQYEIYFLLIPIFIFSSVPILILNRLLLTIKNSKFWIVLILIIYTISWFLINYIIIYNYISQVGHERSPLVVLLLMSQLDNIFISYFLSLILLLFLTHVTQIKHIVNFQPLDKH